MEVGRYIGYGETARQCYIYELINRKDEECSMEFNGLKLTSAAPMEDRLSKYNIIYMIFFIAGCILGAVSNSNWFFMGLIFLIPAGFVKSMIATKLVLDLQKMSFSIERALSGQEMAGLAAIPLTQLGMIVTVDNGEAVVSYKGMQYYIRIYSDLTFGLIFDRSFASNFIGGHRYISQYKKALIAMSLIAFTIQSEMSKAEKTKIED